MKKTRILSVKVADLFEEKNNKNKNKQNKK